MTIKGSEGITAGNSRLNTNGNAEFYPQVGSGGEYLFNNGMKLHSTAAQEITSGANISINASTNANLKAGSGIRIEGTTIYLDSTNLYVGTEDTKAKSDEVEYDPGWGTGTKKLVFINGIFCGTK